MYPNRTIKEIYQEFNENINLNEVLEKIKDINLNDEEDIINFYNENWDRNVNSLSGGEKQILSIFKCIVRDAEFIIFDEPTSNLDAKRAEMFLNIIKYLQKQQKLLIIITHDLSLVEASNSLIEL